MTWRISRAESRRRYLSKFDTAEALCYEALTGGLSQEERQAYLEDLRPVLADRGPAAVLDAGAGTGAACQILCGLPHLALTALEPAPAMLSVLQGKPELSAVRTVQGFCDAADDVGLFVPEQFDIIISRQVINGLYDPLMAFRNWYEWLDAKGIVLILDGLYGRGAWTGVWEEDVDVLPVSACQNMALIPYLLELAGFEVRDVRLMNHVNNHVRTRTHRFLTVAGKPRRAAC